jgi:hypothetical protein
MFIFLIVIYQIFIHRVKMDKVKCLTVGDPHFMSGEPDKKLMDKVETITNAKPDIIMSKDDTLIEEQSVLPDMEILRKAKDFLTKLNTSEGKFTPLSPGIHPIPQKYCGYCKGTGIDPFHEKLCPECENKSLFSSGFEEGKPAMNIARGGDWVSSMYMKTRTPKMWNSEVGTIKKCKICSKKTTNKCSRCKRTYYCSQKCQRDDWKEHKKTCKAKD